MKSKSFKCVVIGCRMKEKNVDQAWGKKLRIPLHCNPKDPALSKKWKDTLLLWNKHEVPNTFHVCSAHFNPENVIVQFGRTKLAPNSVPTIQDSTYLILNDVEKLEYLQNTEIKLESVEYENVEYLDFDNGQKFNETVYETDPLNLYTVKEEIESDELEDQNTIMENGYKHDEVINSPQLDVHFSKPKEEKLRVKNGQQRTSESLTLHIPSKQEVPYKPANLTNFLDCKIKLRRFDRILKVLRGRNSRQTIRIMELQKNLSKLKSELNTSNQALALLLEPDFEFSDSQASP